MSLHTNRIKRILSARHHVPMALLAGLSVGALALIVSLYFPLTSSRAVDATVFALGLLLVLAWTVAVWNATRSGDQAQTIAAILEQPGIRATFDRERKVFKLEQVEHVDLGFGAPAESVSRSAEVTMDEMQLIGLEMMDGNRRRLLLQPLTGGAQTTTERRPETSESPGSEEPLGKV